MIQIDWKPDNTKLRQFSAIFFVGMGLLGLLFAYSRGTFSGEASWTAPLILWAAGLAVGSAGLAVPPLVRPLYLAWMGLAFPLGWLMSHLFLAFVFFVLFTPVGLFFRLVRRDPLQLRRPKTPGYWIGRKGPASSRRYFQQF